MLPNGEETAWSAPVSRMPKLELELRRNATGSLVQNLRAGFVPLESANRTSWYSVTAIVGLWAISLREKHEPSRRG
jgi:hypothetical protein